MVVGDLEWESAGFLRREDIMGQREFETPFSGEDQGDSEVARMAHFLREIGFCEMKFGVRRLWWETKRIGAIYR